MSRLVRMCGALHILLSEGAPLESASLLVSVTLVWSEWHSVTLTRWWLLAGLFFFGLATPVYVRVAPNLIGMKVVFQDEAQL